jgi:MOSC domain-containing protein
VALSARIAALYVYPVKSCRGIQVAAAAMTERGFAHDREWMIVDESGRFLSQREVPALALIRTALSVDALELSGLNGSTLSVPFDRPGASREVAVWRDTVQAIDQGAEAASCLSARLGREVRLVRFDSAVRRACNRAYVGESGAHTGFADAYPLLVISEASLVDLNGRLVSTLPMNRFRPNVVLADCEAYDEDHIDEIAAATIWMKLVKPCTRCQITTTDQETGERGSEPLATLASYRMNTALEGVAFGVNAIPTAGFGATLSAGDRADCTLRF